MPNIFLAASASLVLVVGTSSGVEAFRSQLISRPYDLDAVRKAAAAIQREVRTPSHQEDALGEPFQFIVESLAGLTDLEDVPDDVLDAVVAVAGSSRMATDTLARFGDRGVRALIRSARTRVPRPPYPGGAMYVLQEMLLGRTDGPAMSEASGNRVRAMVRDLFGDMRLDFVEIAALGCLAAATGDPELRVAASQLADPSSLSARGVPAASQAFVITRIRRALE